MIIIKCFVCGKPLFIMFCGTVYEMDKLSKRPNGGDALKSFNIYLRSLFKIRARDWSKSITCVWLPGNNKSFECVITIMHEKCAVLKMARSKTSRKLYLQEDKANKLMKISMNSIIKTKKENNRENFYRQR